MKGNNVGKLKQIHWRDSNMYLTQCAKEDDFKVATIISVGYVVSEDKKQIVLAGDVLEDSTNVRRVIVIPKENIISSNLS